MFPFFVLCSSFVPLPVRLAPSFVRHLFVLCSFFVRSLFVLCSFFVRLLFVFCSSFVRLLFVFSLSACAARTVICSSFLRPTFPLLHSLSLGEGWGEDILFVFYLSVRVARTVLRLSVRLAPACATRTFNASFFTKLLPHTYQNTSQRFFSRQS